MTNNLIIEYSLPFQEIIGKCVSNLRQKENTDLELLDLLIEHILTETPASTAINDAALAIEKLAVEREKASNDGI